MCLVPSSGSNRKISSSPIPAQNRSNSTNRIAPICQAKTEKKLARNGRLCPGDSCAIAVAGLTGEAIDIAEFPGLQVYSAEPCFVAAAVDFVGFLHAETQSTCSFFLSTKLSAPSNSSLILKNS